MLNSPTDATTQDFEHAASSAPIGALALCGMSVAVVIAIWVAFYFLAFLPRGMLQ